jgi:hypothetical protein
MISCKLYLRLVGYLLLFAIIFNVILVYRHLSLPSISLTNKKDDFTLSTTWRNDNDNDNDSSNSNIGTTKKAEEKPSGIATPSSDLNLRSTHHQVENPSSIVIPSTHRQDNLKKKEENADKKDENKKKKVVQRISDKKNR